MIVSSVLERFYEKKVNKKKEKISFSKNQLGLKVKTSKLLKARENAGHQAFIGFRIASDWLGKWCEFSGPITEKSKVEPEQSLITFDT